MINVETKKAYSEILEILKYMPLEYVEKIPKQLIEIFKKEKMEDYEPQIDKDIVPSGKELQEQTLQILAMLNYNYWCDSEEHKKELYDKYKKNEIQREKELKEKYDIDKIFERRAYKNNENENKQEVSLVEYKNSIFSKIIIKLRKIFLNRKNK